MDPEEQTRPVKRPFPATLSAMLRASDGILDLLPIPTFIVDAQGVQVWSRDGLHPTDLGNFHLSFRRTALGAGQYRIDLFGLDGEGREKLATYELRLP